MLSPKVQPSVAPQTTALPGLPDGKRALRYALLADGALAVVIADADIDPMTQSFAALEAASKQILTLGASGWLEAPVIKAKTYCSFLDRFSDGRWLIVGSRMSEEPNTLLLASDGSALNSFSLGDGIEDVAIDAEGRIWVSWFDEGVFGNSGWLPQGASSPPSENSLACFDQDGSLLYLPEWPAAAGNIVDCYALNASGRGAWACAYTDFPLAYFGIDGGVRWWSGAVAGPRAIAIDGDYALLAGGYGRQANRLALLHLTGAGQGEPARIVKEAEIPLRPLPPSSKEYAPVWHYPSLLTGRGDTIHLVDAGLWHRWRVADFVQSA